MNGERSVRSGSVRFEKLEAVQCLQPNAARAEPPEPAGGVRFRVEAAARPVFECESPRDRRAADAASGAVQNIRTLQC